MLIEAGADTNAKDDVRIATSQCGNPLSRFLYMAPFYFDGPHEASFRPDAGGGTPIHNAAWHGHTAACMVLVEAGADVDEQNGVSCVYMHQGRTVYM